MSAILNDDTIPYVGYGEPNVRIRGLELSIQELRREKKELQKQLAAKNSTIEKLNNEIDTLNGAK
jgi:peptidoglycan hydrolase CwlO-like protein